MLTCCDSIATSASTHRKDCKIVKPLPAHRSLSATAAITPGIACLIAVLEPVWAMGGQRRGQKRGRLFGEAKQSRPTKRSAATATGMTAISAETNPDVNGDGVMNILDASPVSAKLPLNSGASPRSHLDRYLDRYLDQYSEHSSKPLLASWRRELRRVRPTART